MPLTSAGITASIIAAGPTLKGANFLRLANALGIAVAAWALIPPNLVVLGVCSGAIGAGKVTGKLFVPPVPLPVSTAAAAATLLGVQSPAVSAAIGVGVANAFTASATYQGVSAGVGVGADTVVRVIPNPAALIAAISAGMASAGIVGVQVGPVSLALGNGISALLASGSTGFGVVTGVGGPSPSGGTSISQVI